MVFWVFVVLIVFLLFLVLMAFDGFVDKLVLLHSFISVSFPDLPKKWTSGFRLGTSVV